MPLNNNVIRDSSSQYLNARSATYDSKREPVRQKARLASAGFSSIKCMNCMSQFSSRGRCMSQGLPLTNARADRVDIVWLRWRAQSNGVDRCLFITSVQSSGIPRWTTSIFSTRRTDSRWRTFSLVKRWFRLARMTSLVNTGLVLLTLTGISASCGGKSSVDGCLKATDAIDAAPCPGKRRGRRAREMDREANCSQNLNIFLNCKGKTTLSEVFLVSQDIN